MCVEPRSHLVVRSTRAVQVQLHMEFSLSHTIDVSGLNLRLNVSVLMGSVTSGPGWMRTRPQKW